MPVKLQVPERYAPALAEFLRLPPAELAALLKSLKEERPTLELGELAASIAGHLSVDASKVQEIIRFLASLFVAREGLGLEVRDFVAELRAAIEASGKDDLKPADWTVFQDAITEALSSQSALSVSAKAVDVMQEHPRVYCYGRVLTDLRPIFRSELEQQPAFLVVHTLKLVYHEGGEHKEFFVALDSLDIKALTELLERAQQKEKSLKVLTEDKGLSILEVKA